jgi:hypothetical protein
MYQKNKQDWFTMMVQLFNGHEKTTLIMSVDRFGDHQSPSTYYKLLIPLILLVILRLPSSHQCMWHSVECLYICSNSPPDKYDEIRIHCCIITRSYIQFLISTIHLRSYDLYWKLCFLVKTISLKFKIKWNGSNLFLRPTVIVENPFT